MKFIEIGMAVSCTEDRGVAGLRRSFGDGTGGGGQWRKGKGGPLRARRFALPSPVLRGAARTRCRRAQSAKPKAAVPKPKSSPPLIVLLLEALLSKPHPGKRERGPKLSLWRPGGYFMLCDGRRRTALVVRALTGRGYEGGRRGAKLSRTAGEQIFGDATYIYLRATDTRHLEFQVV